MQTVAGTVGLSPHDPRSRLEVADDVLRHHAGPENILASKSKEGRALPDRPNFVISVVELLCLLRAKRANPAAIGAYPPTHCDLISGVAARGGLTGGGRESVIIAGGDFGESGLSDCPPPDVLRVRSRIRYIVEGSMVDVSSS
ncbi:hypothetical protein AC579_572 [Pseudocercospora musae]|uniref:Uncharacterized protein n=1 Tax=Pseudocercospora musae TaxID=113226 RepID=A0A139IC79_9PEZI|nr:hypothetical protein AC579_572 [Pseudocercospora musae]